LKVTSSLWVFLLKGDAPCKKKKFVQLPFQKNRFEQYTNNYSNSSKFSNDVITTQPRTCTKPLLYWRFCIPGLSTQNWL